MKPFLPRLLEVVFGLLFVSAVSLWAGAPHGEILITDYPSIHEAIKANPGRMIYVPSGDHVVTEKIRLHITR